MVRLVRAIQPDRFRGQAMKIQIEYRAVMDSIGQYVPIQNKRRALVIRFVNGEFGWVCGAFATLPAAVKRADDLNESNA